MGRSKKNLGVRDYTLDGVALTDKMFKVHVRHFYKDHRNGVALTGTIALIYDRKNDVIFLGSSPVSPCDLGRATKRHGYRTALGRAVRTGERYYKSSAMPDKPTSFFARVAKLDPTFADVVHSWSRLEKGVTPASPHENDPLWMNGSNLLNIYLNALAYQFGEPNGACADSITQGEAAFLFNVLRKWMVLSRYVPV
jgi:hypothetical protein